ncbi:hypothetical protein LPJ68_003025 [Coemansia sp. RSA 1086]|nr:hypothetical protein LPJ68_003025 [Coemansia sp. RSA 1086]
MNTQAINDRLYQKKQELAALERVKELSENTDSHFKQYESMLNIALGWSSAFENSALVDIPQTASAEDESEPPENVIRIPIDES